MIFFLVEWVFDPSRELLLIASVCTPLPHPQDFFAILVIAVVQRCPSWVGLLVASFLWKLTECFPVPQKLVLREDAFKTVPAQGPLGPVSDVHSIFSNRDLLSTSMERARRIANNVLEVVWTTLTNNQKKDSRVWCGGLC